MALYDGQDRHFKVLTFQEAKGVAGISYMRLNEKVHRTYNQFPMISLTLVVHLGCRVILISYRF